MRPKSQLVLKDSVSVRPSGLPEFLIELRKNASISGYHYSPPREAQLVDYPARLDSRLRHVLQGRGIAQLYSHQKRCFELALSGKNVVTVTPTASGKTLCYT